MVERNEVSSPNVLAMLGQNHSALAALGVESITVTLSLTSRSILGREAPTLVIFGHSAVGKSAVLSALGFDRSQCDMDVYCQRRNVPSDVDTFLQMVSGLPQGLPIVLSNNGALLSTLASIRHSESFGKFLFIYLRRPVDVIYSLLSLENSDGIHHRAMSISKFTEMYDEFHKLYRSLGDIEIFYPGQNIADLTGIVELIAAGTKTLKETPDNTDRKGNFNSAEDATFQKDHAFEEYACLLKIADATGQRFTIPSPSEMSQITAGGYQTFEVSTFPPTASELSLSGRKLRDIKWRKEEFAGRTTLEIGCQLGFFTFHAAALGATSCTGIDINRRFTEIANKIAINYKKFDCSWPDDTVTFLTRRVDVGDILPVLPDIIIANSIIHWWIIQNSSTTLESILKWLRESCRVGIFFEGCVSASETIMKEHSVTVDRFNEELFLTLSNKLFKEVDVIGRCSYNPERLVARMIK